MAIFFLSSCQKQDITSGYEYQQLGTSARDFLSADRFTSLHIQLEYMPGAEPHDSVLNKLKLFLNNYANKPAGISITKKALQGTGKSKLFLSEVVYIEKKHRTVYTAGSELTAHILMTDGDYENPDILATSYWNTSLVIFGKNVDAYSNNNAAAKATLVTNLLCHEMGHLLGLVNQGTPMVKPHQDTNNGAHCDNRQCVMYYGVETTSAASNTASAAFPLLDSNCHNDLKANGGK